MLLSHLLAAEGVESVVVETRSEEYVAVADPRRHPRAVDGRPAARARPRRRGWTREGHPHRGIYLQWPGERHHLDFVDLTGRSVWVYGQTEVQKDLVAARHAAGQEILYEVTDTALHDLETDRPSVTFTDVVGRRPAAGRRRGRGLRRLVRAVPGRRAARRSGSTWERVYPYSWLGILADVAPSTDELIYAWHPDGFALHSMRSATVSRLYLQVPNDTSLDDWSDDRIWDALATRLGHGQDGWPLTAGTDHRQQRAADALVRATPMRHGRLFLAGDAAHIVPPTGAKGLNLAVADVALLAPALAALLRGRRRRSPTPTPTPRCAGSGAAPTSPGG